MTNATRQLTSVEVEELARLLRASDPTAIAEAVQAVKPARKRTVRAPRPEPSALDRFKANVDTAVKDAERLLALRNELIELQANKPAFGDPNFHRPMTIYTDIMNAYSKLNDSAVYLLPRLARLLDTFETLPEVLQ